MCSVCTVSVSWAAETQTGKELCLCSLTVLTLVCKVAGLTFRGAVVGDVAGHVDGLVIDAEVSHAAHKVPVPDWEVLGQVGNAAEQQRSCQVQRPTNVTDRK